MQKNNILINVKKNDPALFFTMATEFNTPFYFYDQEILQNTYYSLRALFPKQLDIFYSIKANPNIAICAVLKKMGACAEVCSFIELETALKAGFSAQNIIFLGPAKTEEELLACINLDILAIVCESKVELERIALLAERCQKKVNVALRINPNFLSKTASLKMGGQSSQFGIDEDIIFSEQAFFFNQAHIKIIGIHVYNGTRILDAQTIFDNTKNIFELFRKITQCSNHPFTFIDIGGGMGIPYFEQEESLDLKKLQCLMDPIIKEFTIDFPLVRMALESGRFLLAPAGVLISRIVDKKISKGDTYLVVDGGTNCHMAAVGVGSFVRRHFPISVLSKNPQPKYFQRVHIVGPLCTPGDLLAKNIELPCAEIGDLVMVHYSGAYGLTASPVMFLSHGFPAELLLQENKVSLIRSRQTTEDFFKNQLFIGDPV